jgi:protein-disulfide isomerase
VRGPDDALVTLVVFFDFEDSFSRDVAPTLEALRKHYGNDLRIVFKHFPLYYHPKGLEMAEAALAAHAQGQFWGMYDLLLEYPDALSPTDMERHARLLGLDLERFRRELKEDVHLPRIRAEQALAIDLGAKDVPSFFFNGTRFTGGRLEQFIQAIDPVLAKARSIPERNQVYARMVADPLPPGPRPPHPIPGSVKPARPGEAKLPELKRVQVRPNPNAPERGNPTGRIVLESFSDFANPLSIHHAETLRRVGEMYGSQVHYIWRDNPQSTDPQAKLAAAAAREILVQLGSGSFWAYHDVLFSLRGEFTRETLEFHASRMRVDMEKFRRALDEGTQDAAIQEDIDAATAAGMSGTPNTVINGRLLRGAQSLETFLLAIDAVLKAP